ncbi:MAG: hypothetical protein JNM91_01805, partial [Flavobacteriales bacterium]|nr:hypothetical protein [Flavobacteriales bacterium]
LFEGIAHGTLSERHVDVDDRTCVAVVLASGGYPGDYEKGKAITGIDQVTNAFVFQSGTADGKKDGLVTDGGRVLTVSAFGKDLDQAIANAYRNTGVIAFSGATKRNDIGKDLVRIPAARSSGTVQTI